MSARWFAVIDCAQDPRLIDLVHQTSQHDCLFAGTLDPGVAAVAPWLVEVREGEPLMPVWRQHGTGLNWGIMVESPRDFASLRRHLRHFITTKMPDGEVVMFRFWDPRVLPVYFASATPEERNPWFDGVNCFAVEQQGQLQYFHAQTMVTQ